MKRTSLVIAGLLAGALCGLPETSSTRAGSSPSIPVEQKLFYRAESLYRQGQAKAALPDFQRVLQINPGHAGALFYAGVYETEKGRPERARRFFTRISGDAEFGPRARAKLAELLIAQNKDQALHDIESYLDGGAVEQALVEADQAIRHSPDHPELLFDQALTACLTEDFPKATAALEKLRTLRPEAKTEELGLLLHAWQNRSEAPREALEFLLSLTRREVLRAGVRNEIIRLLADYAEDEVAEEYLLGELQKHPENKGVLIPALARYYQSRGLPEKGVQLLRQHAPDGTPDSPQYLALLVDAGQVETALVQGERFLVRWPDDHDLAETWLETFLRWNERDRAGTRLPAVDLATVNRVAGSLVEQFLTPDRREGLSMKTALLGARVAIVLGNPVDAQALIQVAESREMTEAAAGHVSELAQTLLRKNLPETAIRLLAKARQTMPENPELTVLHAQALLQGKQDKSARELLTTVQWEKIDRLEQLSRFLDTLEQTGKYGTARNIVLQLLDRPTLSPLLERSLKSLAERLPEWDVAEETTME